MRRRAALVGIAMLSLLWPMAPAEARSIAVPNSYLDQVTSARALDELRPSQCSAINIQNLFVRGGSSTVSGTSQNDLILGGPNLDTLNGGDGADCLVGGAGIDTLNGGPGTDVCIGGAGLDLFTGCETFIQ